jgi:hypothetical protein
MKDQKLQHVVSLIRDNINTHRANCPDSEAATEAREENQKLFALLDKHGVQPTAAIQQAMLA